jgi:cell division protein FtsB
MKLPTWGISILVALIVASAAPAVVAAEGDQYKKMYEDALNQLKAAQERKNQLAAENERLSQQIEAMKKEMASNSARLEELKRIDADHAEKTFFLRMHYMAWQQFIGRNAELQAKWKSFIETTALGGPGDVPELINRKWPSGEPIISTQPSTAPSTQPATMPSTAPATAPAAAPTTAPVTAPATKP